MKKSVISFAIFFAAVLPSFADVTLRCGVVVTPENAAGLDKPYDFSPVDLPSAPAGYEARFIEHYGRHGSRYAYSSVFYTSLKSALDKGAEYGVLTELGERLLKDYSANYEHCLFRMGDLSDLGWEQQRRIAGIMYDSFPSAFRDADVSASASLSVRSIMSMSSFCLGLQSRDGNLRIREENGRLFLDGTNPRDRQNPFIIKRYEAPFPFEVTLDQFQDSRLDFKVILSKLFTDVDKACEGQSRHQLVRNLYVLVSGMNSIPVERRTDFSGLFTEEEYAYMFEVDSYQRFIEYHPYASRCVPVLLDIIKDTERMIEENGRGATLRFGHDHVVMPVLSLLGINGYEREPESADGVLSVFQCWDSPMAANIQFVFHCPKGKKLTQENALILPLLNGKPAKLACKEFSDGFYKWSDFKVWAQKRIAVYAPVD